MYPKALLRRTCMQQTSNTIEQFAFAAFRKCMFRSGTGHLQYLLQCCDAQLHRLATIHGSAPVLLLSMPEKLSFHLTCLYCPTNAISRSNGSNVTFYSSGVSDDMHQYPVAQTVEGDKYPLSICILSSILVLTSVPTSGNGGDQGVQAAAQDDGHVLGTAEHMCTQPGVPSIPVPQQNQHRSEDPAW